MKFWNFLPPDEFDSLLNLYSRVSGKVLRISKTLGIEGKQLLKPDDEFEALKDFNATYNGVMSFEEKMRLIYEEMINKHPQFKRGVTKSSKKIIFRERSREQKKLKVYLLLTECLL